MKILVATDQKLAGQAWVDYLKSHPNRQISAVLCTMAQIDINIVLFKPQAVLLDMQATLPAELNIIDCLAAFSKKVGVNLLLSGDESLEFIRPLLIFQPASLLSKQSSMQEIADSILIAKAESTYISPTIKNAPLNAVNSEKPICGISLLSKREFEVAGMAAKGMTSKEIAESLGISFKTIEVHRHHILSKLKIKRITALTNLFHQNNLLPLLPQKQPQ